VSGLIAKTYQNVSSGGMLAECARCWNVRAFTTYCIPRWNVFNLYTVSSILQAFLL